MEVLLLLILVLLNGAFAMSEIALVSARRSRLEALAREGSQAARLAMRLAEEPTRFLSTVQVGITSIGILNGIMGEAVLARPLAAWLRTLGVAERASDLAATASVVAAITYVTIVVGELVPKRLGQLAPERVACLVAPPMELLARVTRPFILLLSASTALVLRLLGQREGAGAAVTEADIDALLAEGSAAGIIHAGEHTLVRNVFGLDERTLGSLMVPRSEVVWLDVAAPVEQTMALVARSRYSRYPVCRGSLQDVLGTISAKELLGQALGGGAPDLMAGLQPAVYVPEGLTGLTLLERFRAEGTSMAFVMDEFGGVDGLVTLDDLVVSVFGEVADDGPGEPAAVRRDDGTWLLDGLAPIVEIRSLMGLPQADPDESGRYHTISGLVMGLLGRLARTGDVVTWRGWRLEVVDLDGRRIDKVLASPPPGPGHAGRSEP